MTYFTKCSTAKNSPASTHLPRESFIIHMMVIISNTRQMFHPQKKFFWISIISIVTFISITDFVDFTISRKSAHQSFIYS